MSKTMQLCQSAIYWTTYSHFLRKNLQSFGSEIRCPSDPKWHYKRDWVQTLESYDVFVVAPAEERTET